MVEQYPDTLTVTTGPVSIKDADGNWTTTGAATTKNYPCRYEPNTGNRTIPGDDGTAIDYSGTLYLKTTDTFKVNTALDIARKNGTTIKGSIKNSDTAQLSARIWL